MYSPERILIMVEKIGNFLGMTWSELKLWLHNNNVPLVEYFLKILIGMMAYIIVADIVKKFFGKLKSSFGNKDTGHLFVRLFFDLIQSLILIYVIYIIAVQLNIVEADPLATITASAVILILIVLQGKLVKGITKGIHFVVKAFKGDDAVVYSDSTVITKPDFLRATKVGKFTRAFMAYIFKLAGIAIAVLIVYLCYMGIKYTIDAEGRDLTPFTGYSEPKLEKELGTTFKDNDALAIDIPIHPEGSVSVRTDGRVNLVYVDGKRVAINTSSRKYGLYNIMINEPEIEAVKHTSFLYDGTGFLLDDFLGGTSKTYYYYSSVRNNGIAMTVNDKSNRIVSLTYISDYGKAMEALAPEDMQH